MDPCRWDILLHTPRGCGISQQSLHLVSQPEVSAGILRELQCACGQPFKVASAAQTC